MLEVDIYQKSRKKNLLFLDDLDGKSVYKDDVPLHQPSSFIFMHMWPELSQQTNMVQSAEVDERVD